MCAGTQNALGAKVKGTKWGEKKSTINSYKSRSNRDIKASEGERERGRQRHSTHKNVTNFQCDRIKQLHVLCVLHCTPHTASYLQRKHALHTSMCVYVTAYIALCAQSLCSHCMKILFLRSSNQNSFIRVYEPAWFCASFSSLLFFLCRFHTIQ